MRCATQKVTLCNRQLIVVIGRKRYSGDVLSEQRDDKMKLYERIQMLRKKAGWSQEKLAEKLGVSRQTISKWENGAANPGMDRLQDLADALDITMAELLGTDAQATEDERIAEYEEEIRGLKKKKSSPHSIYSVHLHSSGFAHSPVCDSV